MTQRAGPDWRDLYAEAFRRFGVVALWSSRPDPNPTPKQALAVGHLLRQQGDMEARRLAERLEDAAVGAE